MLIVKLLNCYFELARNKLSYIVKLTNSIQRCNDLSIKRFYRGYSIIEILVVMSLLGITITLVSAAYLSFERRERVKSAALDLKSNLRLAQNKALSGDKGVPGSGEECPATNTLVGWFVRFDKTLVNSYDIIGVCQQSVGTENNFFSKTIKYPEGVFLSEIAYDGTFSSNLNIVNVLFRPIERGVYFFDSSTPPFILDDKGNLTGLIESEIEQKSLKLTLEGFDNVMYEVNISTTGEINEKKI